MKLPFIFVAKVAPALTYTLRVSLDAGLSPGLYPRGPFEGQTESWTDGIDAQPYWAVYVAALAATWPHATRDDQTDDHGQTLLVLAWAIGRFLHLDGADRRPRPPRRQPYMHQGEIFNLLGARP